MSNLPNPTASEAAEFPHQVPAHPPGSRKHGRRARPAPRINPITVLGELLVTAGVFVLLFIGWQLWLNDMVMDAQAKDEAVALSQEWQKAAGTPTQSAPTVRQDPGEPPVISAPGNAQTFGTLIIPRFGSNWQWPLAEGVGIEDVLNLRKIGHYPGTQMPGEVGNMALAAHRTGWGSPFLDANQLQLGDPVYVETADGWYRYVFRSIEYVTPEGVGVLDPVPQSSETSATDRILTLTSCNPLHSVSERLIVYTVFDTWYPRAGGPPADLAGLVQAAP